MMEASDAEIVLSCRAGSVGLRSSLAKVCSNTSARLAACEVDMTELQVPR